MAKGAGVRTPSGGAGICCRSRHPARPSRPRRARARYVEVYETALAAWPVPYAELGVATDAGSTHVIASGPEGAPALVLLPSFAGTALVWRANVEALSRDFRV